MLLTTCPKCFAQFKVQTEQLNVRQGRVMCGRCRHIFDAFQSLTRGPDTTGPHRPLEPLRAATGAAPREPDFLDDVSLPLADEPAARPAIEIGDLEELDSIPNEAAQPVRVPIPAPATTAASDAHQRAPASDNPLLAAGREQGSQTRPWAWIAGSTALAALLFAQLLFLFRTEAGEWVPAIRPWLVHACLQIGCEVPFGRSEAAVRIEASDLVESPGKGGRVQLTATLANRSSRAQDLPYLEVKLTDNANQVVVSRVLRPADYLGRQPSVGEHLAPNAELFVNLFADGSAKAAASGYGLRAFYP
ncbi:MAG TPA: zinc-ribbon and DUF3426 domain-containing protein [Usitatibacteraceae bacterium]|nr:zinc-ribbon and DUF3426 domain-containing protein [Usitatibacteraceae bacterium]